MEDRYACTKHILKKYKPMSVSEAGYNLIKSEQSNTVTQKETHARRWHQTSASTSEHSGISGGI